MRVAFICIIVLLPLSSWALPFSYQTIETGYYNITITRKKLSDEEYKRYRRMYLERKFSVQENIERKKTQAQRVLYAWINPIIIYSKNGSIVTELNPLLFPDLFPGWHDKGG